MSELNKTPQFDVGSCTIIFGPMFSGKTTEAVTRVGECADIGLNCLWINNSMDVRITKFTSSLITSHSSTFKGLSDHVDCIKASKLSEVNVDNFDVIGIDEGQFFPDIVTVVRNWVLKLNKKVIIASLDGDFKMMPFGNDPEQRVTNLISICDPGSIIKKGAICKLCMIKDKVTRHYRLVPAGFTMRTGDGDAQVLVGGEDLYQPVCMKCYQDHNK